MHQEIFKSNFFITIIFPVIIFGFMILIFFAVYSIEGTLPTWVLIFLIIPVGLTIGVRTTKLIVEDHILRYQSGLFSKNNEEVSLHDVSQIITRVVDTWRTDSDGNEKRSTDKITYVLDESGKTFFSFPASLVSKGNRQRFEETITSINPNIQMF